MVELMVSSMSLSSLGPSLGWFVIIVSCSISVFAIYKLVLKIKQRNSSKSGAQSEPTSGGILCPNCQQASNSNRGPETAGEPAFDSPCQECGQTLRKSAKYGGAQNQHPIIFCKTKDLILVPDFVEAPHNQQQQQQQPHSIDWCDADQHRQHHQYQYQATTTRVLTDEKGHSIKIRIASPPPQTRLQHPYLQRHQQHQHQQHQYQEANNRYELHLGGPQAQPEVELMAGNDAQTESCEDHKYAPECADERGPATGEGGSRRSRSQRGASQRSESLDGNVGLRAAQSGLTGEAHEGGGTMGVRGDRRGRTTNGNRWFESGNLSGGRRRHREGTVTGSDEQRDRMGEGMNDSLGDERTGERQRATPSPMDTHNEDSSASERDDGENDVWDSRQETSLDGCHKSADVRAPEQSQDQQEDREAAKPGWGAANEFVMDADLRQTSRHNLEHIMRQHSQQQSSRLGGLGCASAPGSGAGPNVPLSTSGAFPQSGILPAASQYSLARAQVLAESRKTSEGEISSGGAGPNEDSGSGCTATPSRRSSSQAESQQWLLDDWASPLGCGPTLRLTIRRVEAPKLERPPKTAQMRRSLFQSLARSIGRSGSTDSSDTGAQTACSLGSGGSPSAIRSDWFEVSLVEARNVSALSQLASGRRNSADAFYARVFKNHAHQAGDQSADQASKRPPSPFIKRLSWTSSSLAWGPQQQHQLQISSSGNQSHANCTITNAANYDSVSLHSTASAGSGISTTSGASCDCIRLPTLTFARSSSASGGSDCVPLASNSDAYTILCRRSDFPLRISLYQVAKRGGSRSTLGHCVVSLSHLEANLRRRSAPESRDEASSGGADSNVAQSAELQWEDKFIVWSAGADRAQQTTDAQVQLEYRLYQTIFDAIK